MSSCEQSFWALNKCRCLPQSNKRKIFTLLLFFPDPLAHLPLFEPPRLDGPRHPPGPLQRPPGGEVLPRQAAAEPGPVAIGGQQGGHPAGRGKWWKLEGWITVGRVCDICTVYAQLVKGSVFPKLALFRAMQSQAVASDGSSPLFCEFESSASLEVSSTDRVRVFESLGIHIQK